MTDRVLIIVGLGNPGREYRLNRHNFGFMLLDRLAEKYNSRFSRLQSRALIARLKVDDAKLVLAKPQTFMNLSGKSVQGLVKFYKHPLSDLLIAHDDLDLPLGSIRIRPGGGSAGQKGIQSIIECLATAEFPRLRLGIGRPPGHLQAPDYVLTDFTRAEIEIVDEVLARAVDATLEFVSNGLENAMTKYNGTS